MLTIVQIIIISIIQSQITRLRKGKNKHESQATEKGVTTNDLKMKAVMI